MGLTQEQSSILSLVLFMSPFNGGGSQLQEVWSARFPDEIDDFPMLDNIAQYLRRKVMERFDPNVPVDDKGRASYPSTWSTSEKELEQKFKILFSPDQAAHDFESWTNELGSTHAHIAVIFIDIDRFKDLNTCYTETKVDQTILPEAQRLLATLTQLRGGAYRQGGDEFILILPNHNAGEALAFAERVRSTFEQCKFVVDERIEQITVSGGVAVWPEQGVNYAEVLQKANEAKRLAKLSRNIISLAT